MKCVEQLQGEEMTHMCSDERPHSCVQEGHTHVPDSGANSACWVPCKGPDLGHRLTYAHSAL